MKKVNGVTDGARTHDDRNHNPGLYQLSYSHHRDFRINYTPKWRAWEDLLGTSCTSPFGPTYGRSTFAPAKLSNLKLLVLQYKPLIKYNSIKSYLISGAPERTRTSNPRLRRPVLYPVELQALSNRYSFFQNGRGRGIRTPDPLLPKQMRYQTALCPDLFLTSL